jgi:uncharacterized protein YlxW (UPF0749 family)
MAERPRVLAGLSESVRRLRRAAARRAETRGERHTVWRLVKPAAFAGAGLLLVASAVNADGADLRPERTESLADHAQEQSDRVERLQADVAELNADIDELSVGLRSAELDRLERQVDALEMPAGLQAVEGPGLTVVLEDAPERDRDAAGNDVGSAIVHQQDIQAVANALWAGGAEAMTLQGQRVISTTGIKCVGNTVILHGVPYSPPYRISAIGDSAEMVGALGDSPYIQAYLDDVENYGLGWELISEESIQAPAYDGVTEMRYAEQADDPSDS